MLSRVRLLVTPWTAAYQAPPSMGFSRQEYWNGVPLPSPILRLPTPVFLGFPCGSAGKESAYNAEDLGLIPGLGRSPGGRHGNPLQYSCLENPHEQRNLAGYSPWGHKELDTTEATYHTSKEIFSKMYYNCQKSKTRETLKRAGNFLL